MSGREVATEKSAQASALIKTASASVRHLENIRAVVGRLAEEAGFRGPSSFARSWHILMKGSIVQAVEGDLDAARRAKSMARLLIDEHR